MMPSSVFQPKSPHSLSSVLKGASLCALSLLLSACAGPGQYIWFSELPAHEQTLVGSDYVIGVGDTISINVYEQEGLSVDGKVRGDGKLSLPLAGEIVAAGKRPLQLSAEVEATLKQFIVAPRATVNVVEAHPITVSVLGEVSNVGVLTMDPPARLVDALAKAGGLGEYANYSRIFVLRQFPTFHRIRFTWDDVQRNTGGAAIFPLRTGDAIVVE